jgi:CBS domain-containing protein
MAMNVAELMTPDPIVVGLEEPFDQLLQALVDHDISAVPVVDAQGQLAGIVSEADLVSRAAYGTDKRGPLQFIAQYLAGGDPQWLRKAAGSTARELMTGSPLTVHPSDDAAEAARGMLAGKRRHLVVVDDQQRVVGIVSRRDLLRALAGDAKA